MPPRIPYPKLPTAGEQPSPAWAALFDLALIEAVLHDAARRGVALSYAELLNSLGYDFSRPKMRALCVALGAVDARARQAGAPLLAVLVVRAGDGLPGAGWWVSADRRAYRGPPEGAEALAYVKRQQAKAFSSGARPRGQTNAKSFAPTIVCLKLADMIEAPPFPHEQQRIASLKLLQLLDTPIEERFERITRMVCRLLDVPIAIFNLIDSDRQYYKSVKGLTATEAALPGAFCTHALLEDNMLLVPDATADARFHDNPFVTGEYLNIGLYAGCPVRTPDGMPIGTLCAIDTKPRQLSAEQLETLHDLASMVETELRLSNLSQSQTDLIAQVDTAQRLAMIDPLTRLWNRHGLAQLLDKEWAEAVRQQKPITIAVGDIDHFKQINDTLGHPAGDAVLREIARRLLEATRAEDSVGRLGGEEFLIMLTDCLPERAVETVDRLRQTVTRHPVPVEGAGARAVTLSFGVATVVPQQHGGSEALIKAADEALYRAKHGGRNRVEAA